MSAEHERRQQVSFWLWAETVAAGDQPDAIYSRPIQRRNKSLFASFSSEKEDSYRPVYLCPPVPDFQSGLATEPRNLSIGSGEGNPIECVLGCVFVAPDSAPIAPAPRQDGPSRATLRPVTPPRATAPWCPARRDQRHGFSPTAPGWLWVGKAGDRTGRRPRCRARTSSAAEWTEAVFNVAGAGRPFARRRWVPACSSAARRQSPETVSASRLARQSAAIRRPSAARFGASSCRKTTPARPGGRRAIAGKGSGSRQESVNSHSTGWGGRVRALTARAQDSSF